MNKIELPESGPGSAWVLVKDNAMSKDKFETHILSPMNMTTEERLDILSAGMYSLVTYLAEKNKRTLIQSWRHIDEIIKELKKESLREEAREIMRSKK